MVNEVEINSDGITAPIGSFSWSLLAMLNGYQVQRSGWNGKGLYVSYEKEKVYHTEDGKNIKYSESLVIHVNDMLIPYNLTLSDALANDWKLIGREMFAQIAPIGSFAWALTKVKEGKKIQRSGWNGKGMFIYFVPKGAYKPCTPIAESLVNKEGLVEYREYLAHKTTSGDVVPWTISQADVLANDWEVIE